MWCIKPLKYSSICMVARASVDCVFQCCLNRLFVWPTRGYPELKPWIIHASSPTCSFVQLYMLHTLYSQYCMYWCIYLYGSTCVHLCIFFPFLIRLCVCLAGHRLYGIEAFIIYLHIIAVCTRICLSSDKKKMLRSLSCSRYCVGVRCLLSYSSEQISLLCKSCKYL